MSKLEELRNLGYGITLLPGRDINIQLPENQELTQKLKDRLTVIRPTLIKDLEHEQETGRVLYRFQGYSTRRDKHGKGRLVLELVSNDTGEITMSYFNVNITYQRGPKQGKYFKTGRSGRFWVYAGSKFALFWLATFGKTDKWSRLYRQMNRLKSIRFSGVIKILPTCHQITDLTAVKIS